MPQPPSATARTRPGSRRRRVAIPGAGVRPRRATLKMRPPSSGKAGIKLMRNNQALKPHRKSAIRLTALSAWVVQTRIRQAGQQEVGQRAGARRQELPAARRCRGPALGGVAEDQDGHARGQILACQPSRRPVRQDVANQGHTRQEQDGHAHHPGGRPAQGASQQRQVIVQDAPDGRRKDDQPAKAETETRPAPRFGNCIEVGMGTLHGGTMKFSKWHRMPE